MKNIITAKPLENNMLQVTFDDGISFDIDIKPFIKSGTSQALNDKEYFSKVTVEDG